MTFGDEPIIVELFRHHLWANLKLLDGCTSLTPDQLAATVLGTQGTIHETLLHIVGSEGWYLENLGGPVLGSLSSATPPIAEMRAYAEKCGLGFIEVSARLTSADMVNFADPRRRPTTAARHLLQAINHATEHRSQINTILTQIGLEPLDFSGWAYNREVPGAEA